MVIAVAIESDDDVDVATDAVTAEHHGVSFIGVVAADDAAHLERILGGFHSHLAEVIFTAADGAIDLTGDDAAWLALERHGMGQDFVFTVPTLADAVHYAVESLTTRQDQWEGTAILVVGAPSAVEAARRLSLPRRNGLDEGA